MVKATAFLLHLPRPGPCIIDAEYESIAWTVVTQLILNATLLSAKLRRDTGGG